MKSRVKLVMLGLVCVALSAAYSFLPNKEVKSLVLENVDALGNAPVYLCVGDGEQDCPDGTYAEWVGMGR